MRWALLAAALFGLTGVAAGAFGAHALRETLEPRMLDVWETAVFYQLVHAPMLALAGRWPEPPKLVQLAAVAWIAGILMFSGSLYVLALSGVRGLGVITPLGGLAFLVGHGSLAAAAWWSGRRR